MFIEGSEYHTFDHGWDRTFLTWEYFYKHTNPPDLGDDYHICDSMPEASYVYREQTDKEIFDPAGSYVLLIMIFYKHANSLDLGDDYHVCDVMREASYVCRKKCLKRYATPRGRTFTLSSISINIQILRIWDHENSLSL